MAKMKSQLLSAALLLSGALTVTPAAAQSVDVSGTSAPVCTVGAMSNGNTLQNGTSPGGGASAGSVVSGSGVGFNPTTFSTSGATIGRFVGNQQAWIQFSVFCNANFSVSMSSGTGGLRNSAGSFGTAPNFTTTPTGASPNVWTRNIQYSAWLYLDYPGGSVNFRDSRFTGCDTPGDGGGIDRRLYLNVNTGNPVTASCPATADAVAGGTGLLLVRALPTGTNVRPIAGAYTDTLTLTFNPSP